MESPHAKAQWDAGTAVVGAGIVGTSLLGLVVGALLVSLVEFVDEVTYIAEDPRRLCHPRLPRQCWPRSVGG